MKKIVGPVLKYCAVVPEELTLSLTLTYNFLNWKLAHRLVIYYEICGMTADGDFGTHERRY